MAILIHFIKTKNGKILHVKYDACMETIHCIIARYRKNNFSKSRKTRDFLFSNKCFFVSPKQICIYIYFLH